jgi:hypothetical protein
MLKFLLLVGLLLPGFARAEPITLILTAIGLGSIATYEVTGKGIGDHALSGIKGQDCKTVRLLGSEPVCRDRSEQVAKNEKPQVPDTPVPPPKPVVTAHATVNDFELMLTRRKSAK